MKVTKGLGATVSFTSDVEVMKHAKYFKACLEALTRLNGLLPGMSIRFFKFEDPISKYSVYAQLARYNQVFAELHPSNLRNAAADAMDLFQITPKRYGRGRKTERELDFVTSTLGWDGCARWQDRLLYMMASVLHTHMSRMNWNGQAEPAEREVSRIHGELLNKMMAEPRHGESVIG